MKRSPPSASRTRRDLSRRSHATHEWTGACPVIAITNNKGKVVASYTYDAWGVCTIISDNTGIIANVNPFRYRSYYFDQEIGLYYLQSRYYDAQVGRFINGDRAEFSLFYQIPLNSNLFSFCKNEAINNIELDGYFSLSKKFKSITKYFDFGWTKLTINLPKNISIALAILCLIYKLNGIVGNLKEIKKFANGDKLTTAIVAAIPYGSTYITSEFVAWIANIGAVAAVISMAFSVVMACWTGGIGNIIQLILDFVISYFIPPIISLILMLYYGIVKNKGSKYIFKYLGGASIAF